MRKIQQERLYAAAMADAGPEQVFEDVAFDVRANTLVGHARERDRVVEAHRQRMAGKGRARLADVGHA